MASASILYSGTLLNSTGSTVILHIIDGNGQQKDTPVSAGESYSLSNISYISGFSSGGLTYDTYTIPPNYEKWGPIGPFYFASGFDLNTGACRLKDGSVGAPVFTSDGQSSIMLEGKCDPSGSGSTIVLSPGKGSGGGSSGQPSSSPSPKPASTNYGLYIGIGVAVLFFIIILFLVFRSRE